MLKQKEKKKEKDSTNQSISKFPVTTMLVEEKAKKLMLQRPNLFLTFLKMSPIFQV